MTSEVKNRKDKGKLPAKEFKHSEFLNYSLTEHDRERFASWRETVVGDVWQLIDDLLDKGYSISCKADGYNECVAAYIQTGNETDENHGYILVGRGRSATMAILGALFRHYCLFETVWPIETVRRVGILDD